jgi:hypothetical protein
MATGLAAGDRLPGFLAGVDPERLAEARFPRAPTAAVLEFRFPVNGVLDAVRRGEAPEAPEPRRGVVPVFRNGTRVNRLVLTPPMAAAWVPVSQSSLWV